jgi:hypothetical protein
MRLSDFKGEEAIEVFAEIVEPLTNIICDEEIQKLAKEKAMTVKYVKPALKNHKKEIIQVLACLNRKTVEDFEKEITLLNLPIMIVDLINDPEVQNLFRSQGQITPISSAYSGSAMENIEAEGN